TRCSRDWSSDVCSSDLDRRGSELFEAITRQPEYYLTRIELALLEACGAEVAAAVGPRAHVVEYGSGSGRKTRRLLEALEDPVAYTPIEISRSALAESARRLDREFAGLEDRKSTRLNS